VRETFPSNGTIREHGATELQKQPWHETLNQPPVSLVKAPEAKTSSGYEEDPAREGREDKSRVATNTLEALKGGDVGKLSQDAPPTASAGKEEPRSTSGRAPTGQVTQAPSRLDNVLSREKTTGITPSDGTLPATSLSKAATENPDRLQPHQGSGRESIVDNTRIPKEQLVNARVISMGQRLPQDVQDIQKSILRDGSDLVTSGKGWAAVRETFPSNGTIREHGATELQKQPWHETLNQPPVSLVRAPEAKTSSGYEEDPAREGREDKSRVATNTLEALKGGDVGKLSQDAPRPHPPVRRNLVPHPAEPPRAR